MSLPENHIAAEGKNLRSAIEIAANQLGVGPESIAHKLDLAHFRSAAGASAGAETVRIFAWVRTASDPVPVARPVSSDDDRQERPPRRDDERSFRDDRGPRRDDRGPSRDDRGPRRDDRGSGRDDRGPRRDDRGPPRQDDRPRFEDRPRRDEAPAERVPGEVTAASEAADAWVKGLLSSMGREGQVRAEQQGSTVVVFVDVKEGAGHLVGRQGTTLRAIQHLLLQNLGDSFADLEFRIDVGRGEDDRGRRDRGPDRGERSGGDRGGDRGGFRGGDRGDRPNFRDRGDRGDRPRRRDNDEDELKGLARKLALKVRETGAVEVIRRELNSYDRRLVHLEVAEVGGVASRSVGEGPQRRVEIYLPDDNGSSNAE